MTCGPKVIEMNDPIPPLPELAIDGRSYRLTDQQTVDRALRTLYERHPDFFKRIAEREGNPNAQPNDEIMRDFRRFVREELKIIDSIVSPRIFWEARRRSRLMYGMPI